MPGVPLRSTKKTRVGSAALLVAAAVSLSNTAFASPPSSSYKLVFDDEFNGTTLDTMKWNYNYPWSQHGLADDSVEQSSQVSVSGGSLSLTAIHSPQSYGGVTYNYTSGAVNTSGKLNLTYGYYEASMKMPSQQGTWPAFWMLQSGWPPEIDIEETPAFTANNANYSSGYHYTNTSNSPASTGPGIVNPGAGDLSTAYHTYGMNWTSTALTFYFDGNQVGSPITNTTEIAQAAGQYLLLDLGVGGWPGEPNTPIASTSVLTDWVRVWQIPTSTAATTWKTTGGGNWDSSSNWNGVVPIYQDTVAQFNANTAASSPITWSNSRLVGGVAFDTTSQYTLGSSASSLQFQTSTGTASISVTAATTTTQTIASRMELSSSVNISNASTSPLDLTGLIIGTGALIVNGSGTVTVSGAQNTFTGGVDINTGTQGPAVLRASGADALGTGAIVFNSAGNNTTGRLEIAGGGVTLPNAVTLSGRNSGTVAIENISGNNSLTNTITAVSGGGGYIIQSDAGILNLGNSSNAALTANATGLRYFTLQGAGTGIVNGVINNGTGTVNLVKAGTGQWIFNALNTYTGSTNVSQGTITLGNTGSLANSALTVGVPSITSGTLNISSAYSGSAPLLRSLASLNISNGSAVISSSTGSAYRSVVVTPSLTISNAGKVDLNNNDLILQGTAGTVGSNLSAISGYISGGFNLGNWNGLAGITSTYAGADTTHLSALGVIQNTANGTTPIYPTFDGQSSTINDVLVKYTYFGDSNLDGKIDGSDYSRIDNGFLQNLTGWSNGDFNYDDVVNGSDYTLIDNAFNTQSAGVIGSSAAIIASPTSEIAPASVPEPASLGLMAIAAGSLLIRRRR